MEDVDDVAVLVIPDPAERRHPEEPQLNAVGPVCCGPYGTSERTILHAIRKRSRVKANAIITLIADLIAVYCFLAFHFKYYLMLL